MPEAGAEELGFLSELPEAEAEAIEEPTNGTMTSAQTIAAFIPNDFFVVKPI